MMNPETRLSDALVTVTNDGWFGRSAARYQHLQIARMRALESRRFLLRAANDGVSAVINPWGAVVSRAPEFTQAVLHVKLTPRQGATPYLVAGNWLAIGAGRAHTGGSGDLALAKGPGGSIIPALKLHGGPVVETTGQVAGLFCASVSEE